MGRLEEQNGKHDVVLGHYDLIYINYNLLLCACFSFMKAKKCALYDNRYNKIRQNNPFFSLPIIVGVKSTPPNIA